MFKAILLTLPEKYLTSEKNEKKVVKHLLLLSSLLACFAVDVMTPLLANEEQVQDADTTIVAGCAFLGSVEGGSFWGEVYLLNMGGILQRKMQEEMRQN